MASAVLSSGGLVTFVDDCSTAGSDGILLDSITGVNEIWSSRSVERTQGFFGGLSERFKAKNCDCRMYDGTICGG